MQADFSIELGPEAPALELPWEDPEGRWSYIELRAFGGVAEPEWERNFKRQIDRIPEARQFPALRRFLLAANSPLSAWQTAKCSVWADEVEAGENDFGAAFTHNSYIDLVIADPNERLRENLQLHERLAREFSRLLETNEELQAVGEIVVRRCYFHRGEDPEDSLPGYCLTLFLIGYGKSAAEAAECLAKTMSWAAESLVKVQPR